MSHQPFYKNAIRLATALALLVSVMVSPIRPASMASSGSHPDCFRRNFGIPGKSTTNHRPHVPLTSRVVKVKALSSQSKLDLSTLPAGQYAHRTYPSPSVGPERDSMALATDRAIHPLRC